jgi:site-specific recombinase XerD
LDALTLSNDDLPPSQNPASVYLASLPAFSGRRTQGQALAVIADILLGTDCEGIRARVPFSRVPWSQMRYQHTQAVRSKLMQSYSPASVNKMLSALRGVLREAWRLGLMSAEDYQRAVDLERVDGEAVPAGRELSGDEISALMQACQRDKTPAGIRDAAIIGLLYACGLRRGEVSALDVSDFEEGRLVVRGKRNKQRYAYVTDGALDALTDWLSVRGSSGSMFVPVNRGGNVLETRLSAQAIYEMLIKRGAEAGVEDFSPHDFRRSFISDLLDKGADIATVSRMAGHASVQTTARYDRRPEEARQQAAKLLHVPYRKRKELR